MNKEKPDELWNNVKHIYSDKSDYEVGKDRVARIELTNHGSSKTTIYKITYDNGEFMYAGLLDHERVDSN